MHELVYVLIIKTIDAILWLAITGTTIRVVLLIELEQQLVTGRPIRCENPSALWYKYIMEQFLLKHYRCGKGSYISHQHPDLYMYTVSLLNTTAT